MSESYKNYSPIFVPKDPSHSIKISQNFFFNAYECILPNAFYGANNFLVNVFALFSFSGQCAPVELFSDVAKASHK